MKLLTKATIPNQGDKVDTVERRYLLKDGKILVKNSVTPTEKFENRKGNEIAPVVYEPGHKTVWEKV